MELNFKTMASAYLSVLEGYDFIIPEDVPANERTAFHGAAAAAHKSGKSHFDFGGKKYPVTMKKDAAKAINSDTQKEAKEDEPEASTEVDGNDEKEAGMKKVPCPKCEGKGCAHCDEKGYHMSKVESSCGSDGKKSRKESAQVDETSLYDRIKQARANPSPDKPVRGRGSKNLNPKIRDPRKALDKEDDRVQATIKKRLKNESVEEETKLNELSAEEKKLVNQMYDKKGNLTPLGKKVMNHGKKPGDKGYVENTNEEVEQVDEISRSMTPMRNKFGGTVIPKKFDAYKKFVKKNNVDEPTVRMIHDNPDAAESKRMMKNPKIAQAVDLYKAAHMKKESVSEKKKYLSQKDIKRAIASIKPPKKKPTLPKAPWDKKENTLPAPKGGKKTVRSADKKPVNVNVDGKTVTRMEPVTKRSAAAYESVNRKNWVDVLQNKKLQEAEDAKTKTSAPTGNHKSDDATRDTYDKQLATRKGEKDFVDMHNPETPEYADVNRVLPKTFAAFTAGVKAGGGKTNDAPGDKAMPKNDGK